MSKGESSLPYIVSGDAAGLMAKWQRRWGDYYKAPSNEFFNDLAAGLHDAIGQATGHPVEVIDQSELREGMEELVIDSGLPVISLDRAYFSDSDPHIAAHIDATRAVDPEFGDLGLCPRPGSELLPIQYANVASKIESNSVALVDDVIFSARGALEIVEGLRQCGKTVDMVIAGIIIGGGAAELEKAGIEVRSVRQYTKVLDEVCERDFIGGIPMSGRTVYNGNHEWWSAPYFQPFGNPERWASIPESSIREFSKFCLKQTVEVWKAVEVESQRPITPDVLPRPLNLGPTNGDAISVVELLSNKLNEMEE